MKKWVLTISLLIIGILFSITGIYIGDTDDSPGAAGLGFLLLFICIILSRKVYLKYSKTNNQKNFNLISKSLL